LVIIKHLYFLHRSGKTNRFLIHDGVKKVKFFPFYWVKDKINLLIFLIFFVFLFLFPFVLGDKEIFLVANPKVSPVHIVPE